jgi:hypothetical protein
MPRQSWSAKRARQYEHIKHCYVDRGIAEEKAEELAARTVNRERRDAGETRDQREPRP